MSEVLTIEQISANYNGKQIQKKIENLTRELEILKLKANNAENDLKRLVKRIEQVNIGLNTFVFAQPHSSGNAKFCVRIGIKNIDRTKIIDEVREIIKWIDEETVLYVSSSLEGTYLVTSEEIIFWVA